MYAWKRRSDGGLITTRICETLDDLFKGSSFGLPVRDVKDYLPVEVIEQNGKWVEGVKMSEPDRIWKTIVEASSR